MSRQHRMIHLVTLITLSLFAMPAFAATNIDSTFGDEGTILLNSGLGDDEALAIGVQSDGGIITAGYSSNGSTKMLSVSRFTEDGDIDTDFSSAGTLTESLGSGNTVAHSLTIQDDDQIVISGSVEDTSGNYVFIARITDEGYFDTSYGSAGDGYIAYPVGEAVVETSNVLVNDNGEILVSATITPTSGSSYGYFIKTDSDGSADTSFDEDGEADVELSSEDMQINAIRLQEDNKILAGGGTTVDDGLQASLIRINEDGSLDTEFGSDGVTILNIDGTGSTIYDLAIDADQNVIVVGSINNGEYNQSFIGKLDADGNEVEDYGTSGIYTTTYSLENVAYSVSIQTDGTITATGFMTSSTGKDVFVLSVTESSSGQISSTTYIATDIAEADDVAYSVAALDNGNVLTAGSSDNGDDLDSAILRFTDDTSLAATSSDSGSLSSGVTAYGFNIVTYPITDVTRVGAMTGGKITLLQTQSCEDSCESACGGSDNTCYTTCISTCVDDLTVSQRGVVYGTSSSPTYDLDEDDGDSSDTTDPSSDNDDESGDSGSTGSIFPDDPGYAIVRSGYTSDGSGTGTYESELTDITPGTMYYIRAYAVLSDDTVIYGNEYSFATDDACFIATAAFGSILEKHVVLLRQFRDRYLLTSTLGEKFVAFYYHYSPRIADTIRDHDQLRAVVRILLMPLVSLAFFALKTTLTTKIICIGAFLLSTILLAMYGLESKGYNPMKNNRIQKLLPQKLRREAGFTLIELLVVLVIIGVLAGYIGPKIMGRPEEAKRTKAGLQIRAIETALKMYKLDNGSYPSTEQGLQALIEPPSTGKLPPKWREGGYMEKGKVPLDPWGYEFVYLSPGVNADFDLSSYGGDGEAGGDGDAQDINNWEIE